MNHKTKFYLRIVTSYTRIVTDRYVAIEPQDLVFLRIVTSQTTAEI